MKATHPSCVCVSVCACVLSAKRTNSVNKVGKLCVSMRASVDENLCQSKCEKQTKRACVCMCVCVYSSSSCVSSETALVRAGEMSAHPST